MTGFRKMRTGSPMRVMRVRYCFAVRWLIQVHINRSLMKNLTTSDLDNSDTTDIKLDKTPPYGYSGHLDLTKAIITGELSQSPPTAAKAAIATSQPQIP